MSCHQCTRKMQAMESLFGEQTRMLVHFPTKSLQTPSYLINGLGGQTPSYPIDGLGLGGKKKPSPKS